MTIVRDRIALAELEAMAGRTFGDMVKAVVDVERGIMAVDAELHSDEEAALIEDGSEQGNLWGINLYPGVVGDDWLEFDSLINIRPWLGNRTRGITDPLLQDRIRRVVGRLVTR